MAATSRKEPKMPSASSTNIESIKTTLWSGWVKYISSAHSVSSKSVLGTKIQLFRFIFWTFSYVALYSTALPCAKHDHIRGEATKILWRREGGKAWAHENNWVRALWVEYSLNCSKGTRNEKVDCSSEAPWSSWVRRLEWVILLFQLRIILHLLIYHARHFALCPR